MSIENRIVNNNRYVILLQLFNNGKSEFQKMTKYIVIYITTGSISEAKKIGHTLVEEKLVACSNIISPIHSIYSWQGKICDDKEVLMVLKSKHKLFNQIVKRVEELHSYDVPEIIAMPITEGSSKYISWINEETK
tara:strand:- start:2045 stop:2449 length:405 start_codon:yes stop_codon:yes gene_type:complete